MNRETWYQRTSSDLLNIVVRGGDAGLGSDLGNSFVGEGNVFVDGNSVFHSPENDRKGNKQAAGQEAPVGGEHVHILDAVIIESPRNCTTSRLDTLIETGKVRKLAAIVGQGSHEPVHAGLPCGVGETVEHVQDKGSSVTSIRPVLLWVERIRSPGAVIGLLEHITKAPHNHDGDEESGPSTLGTGSTANSLDVEGKTEDVGTNNLHDVVDDAVQCSGTGVEVGTIDFSEVVSVKPVGGQEHGEKSDDVWIANDGLAESHELGLPRRVLHDNDLGAVRANYVLCIDKHPGERSADDGEDKKSN